jgi:hypothetical protein
VYGIDVYWLPLGAGGWFVRLNGRIYEGILARRQHRPPLDLYHSALEVRTPEGRFVIENAWPIPPMPTEHPVASSSRDPSRARLSLASVPSATRCAGGVMGASRISPTRWRVPST